MLHNVSRQGRADRCRCNTLRRLRSKPDPRPAQAGAEQRKVKQSNQIISRGKVAQSKEKKGHDKENHYYAQNTEQRDAQSNKMLSKAEQRKGSEQLEFPQETLCVWSS